MQKAFLSKTQKHPLKKSTETFCLGEKVLSHIISGTVSRIIGFHKSNSAKLYMHLPIDPATPHLGIYLSDVVARIRKDTFVPGSSHSLVYKSKRLAAT